MFDRKSDKIVDGQFEIMSLDKIHSVDFDYIIIAVASVVAKNEIREYLDRIGIPDNKILWFNPELREE